MKSPSLIVLATILALVQHSSQGELKQLTNTVIDTALKTVTESFDKEEKRYVRQVRRPQTEEQILVPEHYNIGYLGLLTEPNELEYIKYNHETRRKKGHKKPVRRPYRPKPGRRPYRPKPVRRPYRPKPGRRPFWPKPGKPPRKPKPGKPKKPRPSESEESSESSESSESDSEDSD